MIENLTEAKSHNNTLSEPLPFLSEQERNCFYKIANSIQIPGERSKAHPLISTYKIIVSEWNKSEPFLAGVISDQSLPRVYRILGALIQGLEKLGCTVTNKLTFIIRNEEIPLEIYELQDKAEHITTKQEEAELRRYEEERKRYAWASKPNIRKYDYMFNGRLCIKVGQKSFRDHKAANVENQLGELFIEMYKVSELLRKERKAREAERRKREEAEILRLEHRKCYEMEVERTIVPT
ncbi:hypothetical protein GCM10010912_61660 [Paenibacillus albidus]|uniref:Uncharacterized protein n=2 Tax=Paenibacillus albidus TaxID=2041023 RepID=A0A917FU17_9BACL|nr:hypothetical protein GCM10010912_61660 [Paenibacillus albidus]